MRLFLTSRERPPLLAQMEPSYTPRSRRDYLEEILGNETRFQHRRKPYVFKPFPSPAADYAVGVIGREKTVRLRLAPEHQFRKRDVSDWETANVLVDISGSDDGQKIGMQERVNVGHPLAVFRSFVDHLNSSRPTADWAIAVNAISREETFWAAVEKYRERISEITLAFVTPNIWGGESETEKALKKLHRDTGAQEVEVKLKNKDRKLHPDSEDVHAATDYIGRGGGRTEIKSGRDTVYNSDNNAIIEDIMSDLAIEDQDADLILELLKKVLRR